MGQVLVLFLKAYGKTTLSRESLSIFAMCTDVCCPILNTHQNDQGRKRPRWVQMFTALKCLFQCHRIQKNIIPSPGSFFLMNPISHISWFWYSKKNSKKSKDETVFGLPACEITAWHIQGSFLFPFHPAHPTICFCENKKTFTWRSFWGWLFFYIDHIQNVLWLLP